MKNVLIVYGSLTGTTTEIATRMKEVLEGKGCAVDMIPTSEKSSDLSRYDLIIIGSTIRAGSPKGGAREFIATNRAALTGRKVAVFVVCITITSTMEAKRKDAEAYPDKVADGLPTISKKVFAGRAPNSGWLGNWMAKKFLGVVSGDFIDWAKIDAWTLSLLDL